MSVYEKMLTEAFRKIMAVFADRARAEVEREGIRDTPSRAAKAWLEWTSGYDVDVPALFKTFQDGGENYDQMIVQRRIPFYSHCEHHLAPIFGHATVGYLPSRTDPRVVGLSKMNRVVEAYARRLQVQERITTQIATAMWEGLKPEGVGVVVRARHFCIESRGIRHHGGETITSALLGSFRDLREVREEFLALEREG